MNKNQTIILAIAAVAVLGIAAVGVYVLTSGDSDGEPSVNFLIQDDEGIYFWAEGKGNNVSDAFVNAASSYGIPYTLDSDSNVSTMFGISASGDKDWKTLCWNVGDKEWQSEGSDMKDMKVSDHKYVCLAYSGSTADGMVDADKAVALKKNPSGIVFLIQSPSGLYFKAGASGATAFDALNSICTKYKIEFTPNNLGISSLFNKALDYDGATYTYWSQYTYVTDSNGSGWQSNEKTLKGTTSNDVSGKCIGLTYGNAVPPTVSPTGQQSHKVMFDGDIDANSTMQANGATVSGKLSVIDGNSYNFTVTWDSSILATGTENFLVKYRIGSSGQSAVIPDNETSPHTYTIQNVTDALYITITFNGKLKDVSDVKGIEAPVAGETYNVNGLYLDEVMRGLSIGYDSDWKPMVVWKNGVTPMAVNEVFASGNTYSLTVTLVSNNLTLENGVIQYIGHSNATINVVSATILEITYTYTL